jgi:hypothetical protein
MDEFVWHFYMDDLWNQMLYFAFLIGVFLMTLMVSYSHVDEEDADAHVCVLEVYHMNMFYVGFIITRVVFTMVWGVELVFDEAARDLYYMLPIRNMISITLATVGLCLNSTYGAYDNYHNYFILLTITVLEYYLNFYKAIHRKPMVDLNTIWPLNKLGMKQHDHDHEKLFECDEELKAVQERCGHFMLVVLGESLIQLLLPSFSNNHRGNMLFLTLFGLVLVWSIAKQFFDAAQRVPHDHALRRCMQSGMLWILFHAISGWFAFLMGVSLKLLYEDLRGDEGAQADHVTALSIGCSGTVLSFTIMRFLHKGWGEWPSNKDRLMGYSLRCGFAILHLTVTWWGMTVPEYVVLVHCCIAVGLNSLDLYNFKVAHVVEGADDDDATSVAGSDMWESGSVDSMCDVISPGERRPSNSNLQAVIDTVFSGRAERAKKRNEQFQVTGQQGQPSPRRACDGAKGSRGTDSPRGSLGGHAASPRGSLGDRSNSSESLNSLSSPRSPTSPRSSLRNNNLSSDNLIDDSHDSTRSPTDRQRSKSIDLHSPEYGGGEII